jgi:prevent-host-death family protein
MKTLEIPIRELHARTGHFVRLAAGRHEIIITERGRPTARICPLVPEQEQARAATLGERRRLRADYLSVRKLGRLHSAADSTPSLIETGALRDL